MAKREWDLVAGSLAPEAVPVTITLNNLSSAFQEFRGQQDRLTDKEMTTFNSTRIQQCGFAQFASGTQQKARNSTKLGKIFPEVERFVLNLADQWEEASTAPSR